MRSFLGTSLKQEGEGRFHVAKRFLAWLGPAAVKSCQSAAASLGWALRA